MFSGKEPAVPALIQKDSRWHNNIFESFFTVPKKPSLLEFAILKREDLYLTVCCLTK